MGGGRIGSGMRSGAALKNSRSGAAPSFAWSGAVFRPFPEKNKFDKIAQKRIKMWDMSEI